uniref:(northern house mosquito) hypothetical protein n=1 Tax=Culex pipiens TaxID=7175 RepID=A0A8D7ZV53_CULPI
MTATASSGLTKSPSAANMRPFGATRPHRNCTSWICARTAAPPLPGVHPRAASRSWPHSSGTRFPTVPGSPSAVWSNVARKSTPYWAAAVAELADPPDLVRRRSSKIRPISSTAAWRNLLRSSPVRTFSRRAR